MDNIVIVKSPDFDPSGKTAGYLLTENVEVQRIHSTNPSDVYFVQGYPLNLFERWKEIEVPVRFIRINEKDLLDCLPRALAVLDSGGYSFVCKIVYRDGKKTSWTRDYFALIREIHPKEKDRFWEASVVMFSWLIKKEKKRRKSFLGRLFNLF